MEDKAAAGFWKIAKEVQDLAQNTADQHPYDYSKWYSINDIYALAWARMLEASIKANHPEWAFDEETAHQESAFAAVECIGGVMGASITIDLRSSAHRLTDQRITFTRMESELLAGAVDREVSFNIQMTGLNAVAETLNSAEDIFKRVFDRYIIWHEVFFGGHELLSKETINKVSRDVVLRIKNHELREYIPEVDDELNAIALAEHLVAQKRKTD